MKPCKGLRVYFKEPFVYFPPAYLISWLIILLLSSLALIRPLTAVCVSVCLLSGWDEHVQGCVLLHALCTGCIRVAHVPNEETCLRLVPPRQLLPVSTQALTQFGFWFLLSLILAHTQFTSASQSGNLVVFLSREDEFEFPIRNVTFLLCNPVCLWTFLGHFSPLSLSTQLRVNLRLPAVSDRDSGGG